MSKEKLTGRLQPIPAPQIRKPDSDESLMSQANQAIENYTKRASSVRPPLGKGISPDHEVFQ